MKALPLILMTADIIRAIQMAFPSLIYQLLNVNNMLCAMEPSAGDGSLQGVCLAHQCS